MSRRVPAIAIVLSVTHWLRAQDALEIVREANDLMHGVSTIQNSP